MPCRGTIGLDPKPGHDPRADEKNVLATALDGVVEKAEIVDAMRCRQLKFRRIAYAGIAEWHQYFKVWQTGPID